MFEKLQNKWKVSGGRLLLILVTFAVGGSLCGYLGRKILSLLHLNKGLYIILYIVLITILWPICVLAISIPLGQFSFFLHYLKRIGGRMFGRKKTGRPSSPVNVAIFASGAGSNAEKIIQYFRKHSSEVKIAVVVSNNATAGVLDIARRSHVPFEIIALKNKNEEQAAAKYSEILKKYKIDFIVLAGYLKKIPSAVIRTYPEKIVNIHPALLPAYGGAGMYGSRVHEAVIAGGEKQSGISIHFVDDIYDNGKVIFQKECMLEENETPEMLAKKIHALEHEWYGKVLHETITDRFAARS